MATKPMPLEVRRKLAKRIADRFVQQKPDSSKADYVPHPVVRQMLLLATDDHREEVVRERVYIDDREQVKRKGKTVPNDNRGLPRHVAMLVRLSVLVDGEWYGPWDEWGESSNEGDTFKSAQSDAIKRLCAMHMGLGLHLWARDHYFIDAVLDGRARGAEEATVASPARPPVDESVRHDVERDEDESVPPEPPSSGGRATPSGDAPAPPDGGAARGLTQAANRAFHARLREIDCDDATYRAAMRAIYNGDAKRVDADTGEVSWSVSVLPRDKAKALLSRIRGDDGADAFIKRGLDLLAREAEERTS